VESTTWVVGSASTGTSVVAAAVGDTLVAPLGTNKVWQGLRVLCGIWRLAVAADAVVRQSIGITVVGLGLASVTWVLKADKRTLSDLRVAPVFCIESVS